MNQLNRVARFLKSTSTNELLSGSMLVFLGGTFSSFLAFILNIFLARKLSYVDYGVYVALVSIFSLLIIPGQSIAAIIVRFATSFHSTGDINSFSVLYIKLLKALCILGLVFVFLSALLSGLVSDFLHISDPYLFIFVSFLVFANYILTLNLSYANSLLRFKDVSLSFAVSGIAKILSGIFLIYLGFEVYGALGAILFLILIQVLYLFRPLRKNISFKLKDASLPIIEMFKYAVPASIAILSLYSFVQSDVILVKHFYDPYQAGLYGGLSLVGKVIFYFTLPIPVVLFPLVVKRHANQQDHSMLLYLAILIVAVPSVLITLAYFLVPDVALKLILGGKDYLKLSPLLGLFAIFLSIYSLNNVFMTYFLSIKKTYVSIFIFLFAVCQVILISMYHSSFTQVIYISIGTSLLLLLSFVLYYLRNKFSVHA